MILCTELSIEIVQFEGDAQLLINAINSQAQIEEDEFLSWIGRLVEEAKQVFQHRSHCSIYLVHRKDNVAAHLPTKSSLNLFEKTVWIKDLPNVLTNIVPEELSNQ